MQNHSFGGKFFGKDESQTLGKYESLNEMPTFDQVEVQYVDSIGGVPKLSQEYHLRQPRQSEAKRMSLDESVLAKRSSHQRNLLT